jgi:ATP-dependent RNA helicase DDX56/DBP9
MDRGRPNLPSKIQRFWADRNFTLLFLFLFYFYLVSTKKKKKTRRRVRTMVADKPKEAATFPELGLDPRLVRSLAKLGLTAPTPVQRTCIPLALEGRDVLARARTGGGKTVAFAAPVVHRLLLATGATAGAGAGAGTGAAGAAGAAGGADVAAAGGAGGGGGRGRGGGGGSAAAGGGGGGESGNAVARAGGSAGAVRALVLVPTRELCHQVARVFTSLVAHCDGAVTVACVPGDVAVAAQRPRLLEAPDIVVTTPARAAAHLEAGNMSLRHSLEMLVVDEADLMLSYGYESDVNRVVSHLPGIYQALLMSATLSSDVEALRRLVLHNAVTVRVADVDADGGDKLHQFSLECADKDKYLVVYSLLKLRRIRGKAIFFVGSTDKAFKLRLFLERFSIRSAVLNPELPQNSRQHILDEFNSGVFDYVIATDKSVPREGKGKGKGGEGEGGEVEEDEDEVEENEDEDEDDAEGSANDAPKTGSKRGRKDRDSGKTQQPQSKSGKSGKSTNPQSKKPNTKSEKGGKRARRGTADSDDGAESSAESDASDDDDGKHSDSESSSASAASSSASVSSSHRASGKNNKKKHAKGGKAKGGKSSDYSSSRGIDFRGVQTVINFDLPGNPDDYTHRIGRTARGGASGAALTLYTAEEEPRLAGVIGAHKVRPFEFHLRDVESFRYRVGDTLRSVTRGAVRKARLDQLRAEILNSQRLRAHFEDNPGELALLRHDRAAQPGRVMPHLRNVPFYLKPKAPVKTILAEAQAGAQAGHGRRGGGAGCVALD